MDLILQAIKAMFRQVWNEIEPLSGRITKAQNTADNALPLIIRTRYDPAVDGDVCDTPFELIDEAYLAGRIVFLWNVGLPVAFSAGEYIQFREIRWGDGSVNQITHKITPDSYVQQYSKSIEL